jgi:hypothetical protein
VSERLCPHWQAEVEQLLAASAELTPAARTAVGEVLASVLAESPLDSRLADSARSLLAALGRPGAQEPDRPPVGARPGATARRTSRLGAIARGQGRLASAR